MNRYISPPAISLPQLVVLKQNCLAEEQIPNKDGDTTNVYVVVKHSPFVVQLGFLPTYNGPQPDLNCLSFDVKLVYDSPEEKEVDFIKHKPFEFRVKVDPSGTFVNIECRLKVLTSQLEDMFFRLRFVGLDPITKRPIGPQLTAISEPIKVISKPEQLRKNLPTQKRKINDALVHVLDRIENSQIHQKDLLDHLQLQIDSLKSLLQESSELPHKKMKMTEVEPTKELSMEETFILMLKSLEKETAESRSLKLKKSLNELNVTTEDAFEFVDSFNASLGRPIGQQMFAAPKGNFFTPPTECRCQQCPHREELMRIEDFYNLSSELNF